MRDTHIAWDMCIISDLFGKNKSGRTKTQCGRRIVYKNIDNENPTCPECKKWLEETKELLEIMKIRA